MRKQETKKTKAEQNPSFLIKSDLCGDAIDLWRTSGGEKLTSSLFLMKTILFTYENPIFIKNHLLLHFHFFLLIQRIISFNFLRNLH